MRAYIPSIQQGASNGERRRQTRDARFSFQSNANSSSVMPLKVPYHGVFEYEDHQCDAWVDFSNKEELVKQTQKKEVNTKANLSMSNEYSRQSSESGLPTEHRINLDPTASTTSSSGSRTDENSPRTDNQTTFHFDIDLVKTTLRTLDDSPDHDNFSKASSSTISTQSLLLQQNYGISNRNFVLPSLSKKVNRINRNPLTQRVKAKHEVQNSFGGFKWPHFDDNISKNAENGFGRHNDGWTSPLLFDKKTKNTIEEDGDDTSWITFTPDSFAPIEQAPRNDSMTKTLASPKANHIRNAIHHRKLMGKNQQKPLLLQSQRVIKDKPQLELKAISVGPIELSTIIEKAPIESIKPSNINFPSSDISNQKLRESSEPKIGKLSNNSTFLSEMLQKKIGNGAMAFPATNKPTNDDLKGSPKPCVEAANSAPLQRSQNSKNRGSSISEKESPSAVEWADLSDTEFTAAMNTNSKYAKYSKMIQVGLPIAVIKNAMQRDGIMVTSKTKTVSGDQELGKKFRIHWTVHNNVRSNTMWAMIQRERHWLANVVVDEEEIASLFHKEKVAPKRTESSGVIDQKPRLRIMDPKRANNCGIILATIKLSYAEIAKAIDTYSSAALTLTQIQGLLQCLPTKEEVEALKKHSGQVVSECERFMVEMMRVENAKAKLEAMSFMKRLPTRLHELTNDFALLRQAGEEIMNSSSLRKILGLTLYLGNRVHGAQDPATEARAICLYSLSQLHQAKGWEGSFLEYVVRMLQRHHPSVLRNYHTEFAHTLQRCHEIQWKESLEELREFQETVGQLRVTVLGVSHPSDEDPSKTLSRTALGRFVLEATTWLQDIQEPVQATLDVLDQLVYYWGENDDTILPHLQQFCRDLDAAVPRVTKAPRNH